MPKYFLSSFKPNKEEKRGYQLSVFVDWCLDWLPVGTVRGRGNAPLSGRPGASGGTIDSRYRTNSFGTGRRRARGSLCRSDRPPVVGSVSNGRAPRRLVLRRRRQSVRVRCRHTRCRSVSVLCVCVRDRRSDRVTERKTESGRVI